MNEKMVKDAESNAEADKKARELVDARNQLDSLIHATKKSITELGDKIDGKEKADIESQITNAESALKEDNLEKINEQIKNLSNLSQKFAEKLHSQNQPNSKQAAEGSNGNNSSQSKKDDDIVDAEFEEVKDEDDKDNKK